MGRPIAKHRIPCFACSGAGTVALPLEYSVTLRFVEKRKVVTPAETAKATGTAHTAACNRLERLRRWGFLDRFKADRNWCYFRRWSAPAAKEGSEGR